MRLPNTPENAAAICAVTNPKFTPEVYPGGRWLGAFLCNACRLLVKLSEQDDSDEELHGPCAAEVHNDDDLQDEELQRALALSADEVHDDNEKRGGDDEVQRQDEVQQDEELQRALAASLQGVGGFDGDDDLAAALAASLLP